MGVLQKRIAALRRTVNRIHLRHMFAAFPAALRLLFGDLLKFIVYFGDSPPGHILDQGHLCKGRELDRAPPIAPSKNGLVFNPVIPSWSFRSLLSGSQASPVYS